MPPYPVKPVPPRTLHPQLWIGLLLIVVCWPVNWGVGSARTLYLFFPLWLGFVLAVDGAVDRRSGTSLLRRSPRQFLWLFVTSLPVWCLFELLNGRTRNWEYLGGDTLQAAGSMLLCALAFSTVMPSCLKLPSCL